MRLLLKKIICLFWNSMCLHNIKHGNNVYINGKSKFSKYTTIGNNCHFNGITIYGNGNVQIGNNFHSGKNLVLLTTYHNYDKGTKIPYDDTFVSRDIEIADNVWIGLNVTILAGVRIGEGAVIQAGSVVVKDIPDMAVAGGNPCNVFKYRDTEHYLELKSNNMFY